MLKQMKKIDEVHLFYEIDGIVIKVNNKGLCL